MARDFSLGPIKTPLAPLERFAQFLQSRGKRITAQRRLIVQQVFSHHDHFDADELMAHLQTQIAGRKLSRPTVYRTLAELVEASLLRKMDLGGRGVIEHDYGYPRHDHLHCEICNQLFEFQSDALERLRDTVAQKHHFQVLGHRMFITGICANCRKRQKKESR